MSDFETRLVLYGSSYNKMRGEKLIVFFILVALATTQWI